MDKYTESIISINVEIICLSDIEILNDNDNLLLVIDVQGFELDVIRGIDWRYPPAYIVVEDDLNKSGSINMYLSSKGYFYLEPGVTVLVPLGLLYVGADANLLWMPGTADSIDTKAWTSLTTTRSTS